MIMELEVNKKIKTRRKWTKEALTANAKLYTSRSEWQNKDSSAYQTAKKMGILEEACGHMQAKHKTWTKESIILDASAYSFRSEWQSGSPGAYDSARRLSILEECCKHMLPAPRKIKWTKEAIFEDAKLYNSRNEWNRNSSGYQLSLNLGTDVTDEACAHMEKFVGTSKSELELLSIIKNIYPKSTPTFMSNKDPQFVGNRFQLDIFVPEVRKGIEFDGIYWHSVEGLRRGRPSWSDDQINNYHKIKDSFFKSKGVEILHIGEADWNRDKIKCINAALSFLSSNDRIMERQ